MKVAVVGSRGFTDTEIIIRSLAKWIERAGGPENLTVVSGGAKGADTIAELWAKAAGCETIIHLPNWQQYGKSAGYKRNALIVRDADVVLAFFAPGPLTKGTLNTVQSATLAGKPVYQYQDGVWSVPADIILKQEEGDAAGGQDHPQQPTKVRCSRCGGTGAFITKVVNGKPEGPGGPCFRCNGKGFLTEADGRRNWGYDNFYMRVRD